MPPAPRGSLKLSPANLKTLQAIASQNGKLVYWLPKGQPVPDTILGSVIAKRAQLGAAIDKLAGRAGGEHPLRGLPARHHQPRGVPRHLRAVSQRRALAPGPTGRHRILQVHPTRKCNLRCVHCYSESAPEETEALDSAVLERALRDAAAEGYTVVGFSGGEPTLYGPLCELLDCAHACGMRTTVTTNGTLLGTRLLESLRGRVDVLAISLDGKPESHNRVRASASAFRQMADRLEGVRASGIPFGFIFTLTLHNLDELEWVASFAAAQGARLLQIHPLEEVGRARRLLAGQRPDAIENSYAHLEALRIQELYGDRMLVQLDVTDARALPDHRELVYADELPAGDAAAPLGELLSPLVIEPDGTVVPLQYGFSRLFALGNLRDADLPELADAWRRERLAEFRRMCRDVYDRLTSSDELPFSNWYEVVAEAAEAPVASS